VIARVLLVGFLLVPISVSAGAPDLSGYRWIQHSGEQLPMQLLFRDEDAHPVRLADLTQGRPLILAFGYYRCPNLCGLVRGTLFSSIGATSLVAGEDYSLAAISIDPDETAADAQGAKAADLAAFPLPGAVRAWHYLTGGRNSIAALTDAAGYEGRFDAALKQFIHPTGLVIVTPGGRISSYLLGLGYHPGDLRVALAQASQGTIRATAVPVLLLCFHYDATTGRYTLSILKLLRLAAALAVVTVAGFAVLLFRREYRA
jgi:protein SCO1/2